MEEKTSEISGPCEEFPIYFCGEVPSGSVAWYFIDVSEKTESSTKKLNPFSVSKHFPSVYYAFLKRCIYSLGGLRSVETLLNDVWILALDIKSLDSLAFRGKEKGKEPEKPQERLLPQASKPAWDYPVILTKEGSCIPAKRVSVAHTVLKFSIIPLVKAVNYFSGHRGEEGRKRILKPARSAPPLIKETEDGKPDSGSGSGSGSGETCKPESGSGSGSGSGETWKPNYVVPWNRGPPMIFARCDPHTMVADQKLYVLGGFEPNQNEAGGFEPNQNEADGWIEVFDPVVGKWEPLPSPPDKIHSSVMISGLLKDQKEKEIIIAKQRWDHDPMIFYSYNIKNRCWNKRPKSNSDASVHLPPNAGRAVTVGNTLYWISTEEHNHECIIRAYDLHRNMWFEDHLNPATIVGSLLERREHFSSIYSSRPGFLHLRDQKFCLLLRSSITKNNPQSSIEYLYCVILDISPIYEHEDRGKFEWERVSVQKYSMDQYIDFLDCMLGVE